MPAVSEELDATEAEIEKAFIDGEQFLFWSPGYSESRGTYGMSCILEKINYLKESSYIKSGRFEVNVTGECSYLDANGQKQTILVALMIHDREAHRTWMATDNTIEEYGYIPSFIQEGFSSKTLLEPGVVLSIGFNLPTETSPRLLETPEFFGDLLSTIYTPADIEAFINTGDPTKLKNNFLVPLAVGENGLYQPFLSQ